MWNPGDVVVWREVFNDHVWHAHPAIVVNDTPEEMVLAFLTGSEGMGPKAWVDGKIKGSRRWEYKNRFWELKKYLWHTSRALYVLEAKKYYVTSFVWDDKNNQLLYRYVNFQLPFQRSHCGIDTLDLELDIIITPDLGWKLKDEAVYQTAINHGVIFPEWTKAVDRTKVEVLDKLDKRLYPFDGSWLDWKPDPKWKPPVLPENWDKI